jgi:hypothetical protein
LGACGLADDDEYSVIGKADRGVCRVVSTWLVADTRFAWAYFDGALIDPPPASALPDTSIAAAKITSVPVMVALYIAASIRFETTKRNRL